MKVIQLMLNMIFSMALFFALLANISFAKTYIYDYDERNLTLDGATIDRLDFSPNSVFNIEFSFDGDFLSGDNPLTLPAITHAGTRVIFSLLPNDGSALPLFFSGGFTQFYGISVNKRLRNGDFVAYFPWNRYACRSENFSCANIDRFFTFLNGNGNYPRKSVYHVSVSSVPAISSIVSLLTGMIAILAIGRRKVWLS